MVIYVFEIIYRVILMEITVDFEFVLHLVAELAVRILVGRSYMAVRSTVRNLGCFEAALDTEEFNKATRMFSFQDSR
jgi:hypothetical protein